LQAALVQLIEEGYTTMRLYEWADRGHLVYLVHVEEDNPGRLARRTLYPFITNPVMMSGFCRARGEQALP
jgi:hypothetical protein